MAAGHLEGEYHSRPQGSVLLVRLPPGTPEGDGNGHHPEHPSSPDGTAGLASAITHLLGALTGRDQAFEALHQSFARVHVELAETRERAGRAEARSDMLMLMLDEARSQLEEERRRRRRWRWPW